MGDIEAAGRDAREHTDTAFGCVCSTVYKYPDSHWHAHTTLFHFYKSAPITKEINFPSTIGSEKNQCENLFFSEIDYKTTITWIAVCVCERERKVKGSGFLLAISFLAVFSAPLNTISLKVFIYQLFSPPSPSPPSGLQNKRAGATWNPSFINERHPLLSNGDRVNVNKWILQPT